MKKYSLKIRLISVVLTVLFIINCFPLFVSAEQQEGNTLFSISDTSGKPGETIELEISVSGNTDISGLLLYGLTYNTSVFEFVEFNSYGALVTGSIAGTDSVSGGIINLGYNPNIVPEGKICKAVLKIKEDAPEGDYAISFSTAASSDNGIAVSSTLDDGMVTVSKWMRGDFDENGIINMQDAVHFIGWVNFSYIPDLYSMPYSGDKDFNHDGVINMQDAVYLIGWINFSYIPGLYDIDWYGTYCAHTMQHTQALAATCTEKGNIEYWQCEKCGKYFSDEAGKNEIKLEDTVIEEKGHTVVIDEAVPATYESKGLTEGSHCSVCHEVIVAQIEYGPLEPNTKSITYHIVDEAKHPYLGTLSIDTSKLSNSYIPGKSLTLINLDLGKFGYTFDGWFDGFGEQATQIKEIPSSAERDYELYAHVTEVRYDITYNTYQTPVTSSPSEEQKHYYVSKGNSNLWTPEINNYLFLGWYDNEGVEYENIPIGTTGHIVLNAYYTSLRNLAKSEVDNNPLIIEDKNNNVDYFTYKIGTISKIPLNSDKPFWTLQSVAGLSEHNTETHSMSISEIEADSISKTISDMTVNSSTWTLSEAWNDVTNVNEQWAETIGKTTQQSKTDATTSSNTLSISSQVGGSSYHKTEKGNTVYDYNSKTETKDSGHKFDASLSGSYTNKIGANLGASTEYGTEASYKADNAYTREGKINSDNWSASGSSSGSQSGSATASDKDKYSSGISYENGFEVNAGLSYGYHNNTNTVTKTGTDSVSTDTKIDESTGTWNNSSAFSATQQHSTSQTISNTLSDIISTTKQIGTSYSKGGSDTSSQGFSSTASNSSGTTSTVTYSKLENTETIKEITAEGKIEGEYRLILCGTAHVYAVVGYDYNTKSYFTYTFSIMDDAVELFIDYTPKGGDFHDCENSCLPFEVPYFVFEYVNEKTVKTTGVQYVTDSKNGTARITGYVGTDTDIIIPSYVSDGKQAYKVTEISKTAFAGKTVRSVVLGEFIKSIPDGAFKNCTKLEEVIGSFTEIGNEAFAGCVKLTNMNIPSNVVKIGTDAFSGAYSIKVRAINSLSAYAEAVKKMPEGTDEEIEELQKEITKEFITSVLESGAKNIVLDLSCIAEGVQLSLEVPVIDYVEINGGTKTFFNFTLTSDAKETVINEMTIENNQGIPIKVDSDVLTLHKVFVNGNNTTLIMKKDGAVLSLVQDSAIQTSSDYAIISKNPVIDSQVTKDGAVGLLSVTGDFAYVNSVQGENNVEFKNGKFVKISEEEFEKYLKGAYTVTFDVNGGNTLSENTKTVYFGTQYGTLPVPTRDYYTFAGWFTAKEGGNEITSDSVFSESGDQTVYAHWLLNPLSDWVVASDAPSDAQIEQRQWEYTLRHYEEGAEKEKTGWTTYDNERTSWGAEKLSENDPSDGERNVWTTSEKYETGKQHHWVYYNYHNGYQTIVSYRYLQNDCPNYYSVDLKYELVNSAGSLDGKPSYKYYHNNGEYGGNTVKGNYYRVWLDREYDEIIYSNKTVYHYQEPVYTYYYYMDTDETANVDPTGQPNVSNVVEMVQYREK